MDLAALRNCCITSLRSAGWLHSLAASGQGCSGNFKAFRSLKWLCSACPPRCRLMIALPSRGSGEDGIRLLWELMEPGVGLGLCPARSHSAPSSALLPGASSSNAERDKSRVKWESFYILCLRAPRTSSDCPVLCLFKVEVGMYQRKECLSFFRCQGCLVLLMRCQQGRNPWPSECPTELCLILLASLIRPTSSQD